MIAYEDTKPVFATLIAPGRGGVPTKGIDPIETASTPVGAFRVDGKFWTGTMTNKAFVHADVPYVLNFHGAHALHMAYWHDNWGEKTSGGCINLSPEDSRWFFLWSEPAIPPGWHGMRSDKEFGPGHDRDRALLRLQASGHSVFEFAFLFLVPSSPPPW